MEETDKKGVTFTVKIDTARDGTWQGSLKMPDGRTVPFSSELELLKLIDLEWERESRQRWVLESSFPVDRSCHEAAGRV